MHLALGLASRPWPEDKGSSIEMGDKEEAWSASVLADLQVLPCSSQRSDDIHTSEAFPTCQIVTQNSPPIQGTGSQASLLQAPFVDMQRGQWERCWTLSLYQLRALGAGKCPHLGRGDAVWGRRVAMQTCHLRVALGGVSGPPPSIWPLSCCLRSRNHLH